jgi:heat shock protein HtpX
MNSLKVGLLLTLLTLAFVTVGNWLGGTAGMILALGLAVAMNVGSYWFSDRIILRITGAQPLDKASAPDLYAMTRRLAAAAAVPMPALYLVPDPQPNAFATGRNPENGVVAVNQGLLDVLSPSEIEGVIAHEIAHIKHRDTLTMTIAASLAGAIMTLINIAQWSMIFRNDENGPGLGSLLVAGLIAPLAAGLIQMAISRSREYEADRTAATLTGSARGLIRALRTLDRTASVVPSTSMRESTAHLAIVNPLSGAKATLGRLFSTHPPLNERIAALEAVETELRGDGRTAAMAR